MLSFRLADGVYVLPHITDMRSDIDLINGKKGDNSIRSLKDKLVKLLADDGPAELLRLDELEKRIDVRVIAASRSPFSAGTVLVESQNKEAFVKANENNSEFGDVNTSRTGRQAYDVSDIHNNSSRQAVRLDTYLVSRQDYYVRELTKAKEWIAARRKFINNPTE